MRPFCGMPFRYGRFPMRSTFALRQSARSVNSLKYPPPPSYYGRKHGCRRGPHFGRFFFWFVVGAAVAYHFSIHDLVQNSMHPLPTNDEEKREYTQRLENRLQHLRIVRELSRNPDLIQTRSWESFNTISKLPLEDQDEPTGTIRDPLTEAGGIPIPPLVFNDPQNKKAYVIMHLGRRLSGYPLIVHGGIIGLLVDEVFKKSCAAEFGILDVNRLHTERSTLNYRSPTFVNTFVLFETQCYDLGGGRYRVVGKLSNAQNRKKLAEAETIITQGPLPTWPASPVIETVEEKPESKGWGLWAR